MRVLYFPHRLRTAYFLALLEHAKATRNWRIGAVDNELSRGLYDNIIDAPEDLFSGIDWSEPCDVDHDEDLAAAIDAKIAAVERANRFPAGRIVLAVERSLGAAFAKGHYVSKKTKLENLAQEEGAVWQVMRRLFWYASRVLDEFQPDVLIAGQIVDVDHIVVYLSAVERGIPVLIHRQSKLLSGRAFWTRRWDMMNGPGRHLYDDLDGNDAPPSARAKDKIAAFRERPTTVEYIRRRWQGEGGNAFLREHKNYLMRGLSRVKRAVMRQPKPPPVLPAVWHAYHARLLNLGQRGCFTRLAETELSEHKYVYLALHKEPELATHYQAPGWRDQKNVAALVAAGLPFGYELLVREHRFNLGRRPNAYYRFIGDLPNVTLIDALDDQFKYVRHAALIVTENGSTGWEGLVLGRPVIRLADSFYAATELAHHVSDPNDLGRVMTDILLGPEAGPGQAEHDLRLARLLEAEYQTTVVDGTDQDDLEACLSLMDQVLAEGDARETDAMVEIASHVA